MKVRKIIIGFTAFLTLIAGATACGSANTPAYTRADCKVRLTHDMAYAQDHPDWDGNKVKPKECKDISDEEAEKVVGEVVEDAINQAIDEELDKL